MYLYKMQAYRHISAVGLGAVIIRLEYKVYVIMRLMRDMRVNASGIRDAPHPVREKIPALEKSPAKRLQPRKCSSRTQEITFDQFCISFASDGKLASTEDTFM